MYGPRQQGHWTRGQTLQPRHDFLEAGRRYRVSREFVDFDGDAHLPGEEWTFLGASFLPHEDGLSLFVSLDGSREWHVRMQWRADAQGAVLEALSTYVSLVESGGGITSMVDEAERRQPVPARYERVYTVTFYWDCPRSGVADFRGRPHHYESSFDESADGYTDFVLKPLTEETLQAALEQWGMCTRWYRTYYGSGEFPKHDVPVFPEDRDRYLHLHAKMERTLAATAPSAVGVKGHFRCVGAWGPSALTTYEVSWEG